MPRQEFQRPSRNTNRREGRDIQEQGNSLSLPERQNVNPQSQRASEQASGTLGNIDDLLANTNNAPTQTGMQTQANATNRDNSWYNKHDNALPKDEPTSLAQAGKNLGDNTNSRQSLGNMRSGGDPQPYEDMNERFKDYRDADANPASPQELNKTGAKNIGKQESLYSDDQKEAAGKRKLAQSFRARKSRTLGLIAGIGGAGLLMGGMMGAGVLFKGNLFSGMLDNWFGKGARHAVEHRLRAYMFGWIKKDLLEGAKRCGSTVKLTCINRNSPKAPKGLLGTFVLAMRQANVNAALVNKGISFSYTEGARGQPGTYKIITKQGITEVPDTADAIGKYRRQTFLNGKAFDREMKNVIAQHFSGSMKRKVIKAVRRNTGHKMCYIFCNRQDNNKLSLGTKFAARKAAYYNAWTALTFQIVLSASAYDQALLICLLGPCNKSAVQDKLREINSDEARRLLNDPRKIDKLVEEGAELRGQSRRTVVGKRVIRHLLLKVAKTETADAIIKIGEKTLGPVGLGLLAIALLSAEHKLIDLMYDFSGDRKLAAMWDEKKKSLDTGAYSMVSTGSDEMFGAGEGEKKDYDLAALAAFNDRLDGIEKAPAYAYLFGSRTKATTVAPDAAKCKNFPIKLENDKRDGPQIFCADDRLGSDPPIVRARKYTESLWPNVTWIMTTAAKVNYWGLSWIASILQEHIIHHIEDWMSWILFGNPASKAAIDKSLKFLKWAVERGPIKSFIENSKEFIEEAMGDFFQMFLPLAAREAKDLRGAALSTSAMVGADLNMNRFTAGARAEDGTVSGLGAPEISRKQANNLYAEIEQDEREDLKYASVSERYFSLNNPNSLLAQTIVGGPASSVSNTQAITAMATNPFGSVLSSMASLLSTRVHAAATIQRVGATGVPTHAYLTDSAPLVAEPLEMSLDECHQAIEEGFKKTDKFDSINEPIYSITKEAQQCMLDYETVGVGTLESKGGTL